MSSVIVGIDEAGRGPLAGPVVAAAVALIQPIEGLNDSKKLSAQKREALFDAICDSALVGVAAASAREIDSLNIHHATLVAMNRAFQKLGLAHSHARVFVDGRFVPPDLADTGRAVIGGDRHVQEIMAASIVAKVTRDHVMQLLDRRYPHYDWQNNAGYPVPKHRAALLQYGVTAHHRRSFSPVRNLLV